MSVATVSRALNRPEALRASTLERVRRTIDEMDYSPDPVARRLSTGRTRIIRVVTPFLTLPSFVERLRGVEDALNRRDYDLMVTNVESSQRRAASFDRVAKSRGADGIVMMTLSPTDREVAQILESGWPAVLVDGRHPRLPTVDVDDFEGGRLAADHLLSRGHRRIGFVGDFIDPAAPSGASGARLTGLQARLTEAGLALPERLRFRVRHSLVEGMALVEMLLALPAADRPSAIFAASDLVALGMLVGLRRRGLRAPDDLAIVGFDDLVMSESYGLTTIRQPLFETGALAVEILLGQIDGRSSSPSRILLPLTLVAREST